MTPAEIVKVFEDRIGAGKAAVAAADARAAAVKADRDERAKTAPFAHAFRRIVIGMFLQSPDTLGAFGLTAPKVGKKTAATKATAVTKATATKKGARADRQEPAGQGDGPCGSSGQPPAGASGTGTRCADSLGERRPPRRAVTEGGRLAAPGGSRAPLQ